MTAPLSFEEMRETARRRLPRGLFDYIDRGVGEEHALRALRIRLDAAEIVPRVLRSDSQRNIACQLFDENCSAPFIVAPTAMAGLIAHNGEIAVARAATRLGIPVCLSTQSVISVGRLRDAVPDANLWMQLYLWEDLNLSLDLMRRAQSSGVRVLVLTVDTPYGARKEWNIRSGFGMPFRIGHRSVSDVMLRPGWVLRTLLPSILRNGLPALENYPEDVRPRLFGPAPDRKACLRSDLNWDDVAWVRDNWNGRLILKGVLAPEDARIALELGADGIVVSSHGARNLDAAPAPVDVLSGIADAVVDRTTVIADSGIRRGLDVLRYRTRGAQAVMLGRLPLWALAAGGEQGVWNALDVLRQEYIEALDMTGVELPDRASGSRALAK